MSQKLKLYIININGLYVRIVHIYNNDGMKLATLLNVRMCSYVYVLTLSLLLIFAPFDSKNSIACK